MKHSSQTPFIVLLIVSLLAASPRALCADGANSVPNPNFEQQLATLITTTVENIVVGTAEQFWSQSFTTGSFVQTTSEDSTDTLAGGTSKMLGILTDAPGAGGAGATITVPLRSSHPPGATGRLDVRVVSGTARIGFLRTEGPSAEFLPGSVLVTGGGAAAPWQHVTFTGGGTAAVLGIRVFAPAGGEAEMYADNAVASPAPVARPPRYDYIGHFGPARQRGPSFCFGAEVPLVGDFNGDGLDEVVNFWRDTHPGEEGTVQVALNYSSILLQYGGYGTTSFCTGTAIPAVGDFDGDGRDDILCFEIATGKVWVALADQLGFAPKREWYDTATNGVFLDHTADTPVVGDFNGDRLADIAIVDHGPAGFVFVALNNGRGFGPIALWMSDFCKGAAVPRVGDVNGDGRDDLVSFVRDSAPATAGDVEVALSSGAAFAFGGLRYWHQHFAPSVAYEPLVADISGDGSADIIAVHADGAVFCAIKTTANTFASGAGGTETADPHWQWHHDARNPNEIVLAGRFNGDRNADLFVCMRDERPDPERGGIFVTLCGGHAEPEPDTMIPDFGWGAHPLAMPSATVPLLVLLSEVTGYPLTRTVAEFRQGVFGPAHPNVVSWVREMSRGQLQFTEAVPGGIISYGPLDLSTAGADPFRWHLEKACDTDGPGGFEMKNFDTNLDGMVDRTEVQILAIASDPAGNGHLFGTDTTIFPGDPAREVRVAMPWPYAGDTASMNVIAHELCHAYGMVDTYGAVLRGRYLTLATDGIVGPTTPTDLVHIDPYNKMRMGWNQPLIFDIAHFPAGAAIAPPQDSSARPVLLYDSTRGTHDYHIVEHRNGELTNGTATWTAPSGGTWRPQPRTSFPQAGYDIDVQDDDGGTANRKGFAVWAVKTDVNHQAIDVPTGILAGPDGVLDSTPIGDDVLWTDGIQPSQVHPGPNAVLDSALVDDDKIFQDALMLPRTNPADIVARLKYSLVPSGAAETTLQYYDGSDSGVAVLGDNVHGNAWQYVEWGKHFRPHITSLYTPEVAHGDDAIALTGELGAQNMHIARMIGPDGVERTLSPHSFLGSTWSGKGAAFRIPYVNMPSGTCRFVLVRLLAPGDASSLEITSNTMEFTYESPLDVWRRAHFTPEQLDDPAISGETADPDGDGIANIAESGLGTNPLVFEQPPIEWELTDARISADFYRTGIAGGMRITLQTSTDLVTWTDTSSTTFGGGPGGSPMHLQALGPFGPRAFARLKFTRL